MATTVDLTIRVYYFQNLLYRGCCRGAYPLRNAQTGRECWPAVTVLLPSIFLKATTYPTHDILRPLISKPTKALFTHSAERILAIPFLSGARASSLGEPLSEHSRSKRSNRASTPSPPAHISAGQHQHLTRITRPSNGNATPHSPCIVEIQASLRSTATSRQN
jgi:hypothetical protein